MTGDWITNLISKIGDLLAQGVMFMLDVFVYLVGNVVILLMNFLVRVCAYNEFVRSEFVSMGWPLLRDLVNMFFILALLFIAFVTVLKIEKYEWNKLLARLLLMAILVNFSRTVCGLVIDFFQVIMITFVNAFKAIAEGSLWSALGIQDFWKKDSMDAIKAMGAYQAVANTMLGLVFIVVLMIVLGVFVVILLFRIIALWILIVFSPLAFFAWVFEGSAPKIGKYYEQWWSQFLDYCMVGPILAFFIWLSLSVVAKVQIATYPVSGLPTDMPTTGGAWTHFYSFATAIVLLVAGLKFAGDMRVVGASYASQGANWIKGQTQGRLENYARRAGSAAAGVAYAPIKMAGVPVRGAMQGVSDRMRDSKYLRYATKEGRSEAAKFVTARARGWVGPQKLAEERVRQELEQKDVQRLSSEGALLNPEKMRERYNFAMKKNNFRDARAILAEGARKGWVGDDMVADFKMKFGAKMKEMPLFEFTDRMESDYKAKTGVHKRYNDMYITEEGTLGLKAKTPGEEITNAVGRMDFKGQSQMAEQNKSFKSQKVINSEGKEVESNLHWKEQLMAYSGQTDNFGHYNPLARKNIASAIEDIAKDPEKLKKFSEQERTDLNRMYEAATTEYQGRTGIRVKDEATQKPKRGKLIFGKEDNIPDEFKGDQGMKDGAVIKEGKDLEAPAVPAEMPRVPTVPASTKLSRTVEKMMGPKNYEKLMAANVAVPAGLSRYLSNIERRTKGLAAGELKGLEPQAPKPVRGVNNFETTADVRKYIKEESQPDDGTKKPGILDENQIVDNESRYQDRKDIIEKVRLDLLQKGMSVSEAPKVAEQIVAYKEDEHKYNKAKDKSNNEILVDIRLAEKDENGEIVAKKEPEALSRLKGIKGDIDIDSPERKETQKYILQFPP